MNFINIYKENRNLEKNKNNYIFSENGISKRCKIHSKINLNSRILNDAFRCLKPKF